MKTVVVLLLVLPPSWGAPLFEGRDSELELLDAGVHNHTDPYSRNAKLFNLNQFDLGDIAVGGQVSGDKKVSIGHSVGASIEESPATAGKESPADGGKESPSDGGEKSPSDGGEESSLDVVEETASDASKKSPATSEKVTPVDDSATDLCSGKRCGEVCDTSLEMLQVMRYCQPDGSCGTNARPSCPGKPTKDACLQTFAAKGPCEAYIPSWSYNLETGVCEKFNYGGCQGNENRFGNHQECKDHCENPEVLKKEGENCGSYSAGTCEDGLICKKDPRIPDKAGVCTRPVISRLNENIEKFDKNIKAIGELKTAIQLIGDHLRSLSNSREKRQNQLTDDELSSDETELLDIMDLAIKHLDICGNGDLCESSKLRDVQKSAKSIFKKVKDTGKTSKAFRISFDDKKSKVDKAASVAEKAQTDAKSEAIQELEKAKAKDLCTGKRCGEVCDTSFGMLQVMRYCQPDGSCGTNARPSCPGKPAKEACLQTFAVMGPCKAAVQSWSYNLETSICEKFTYGGCQGNENRFGNHQECKDQCENPVKSLSSILKKEMKAIVAGLGRLMVDTDMETAVKIIDGEPFIEIPPLSRSWEVLHPDQCTLPTFPIGVDGAIAMATADTIHTCGGSDENSNSLAICHTLQAGKWTSANSMLESRTNAAGIMTDYGWLVTGGRDNSGKLLDSIEINKIDDGAWTPYLSQLHEPSEGHCLVQVNRTTVFVTGGHVNHPSGSGFTYSSQSSMFNIDLMDYEYEYYYDEPDYISDEAIWSKMADMKQERAWHQCFKMGDSIVVAGGSIVGKRRSVEVFDLRTEQWRQEIDLPEDVTGGGLVSVKDDVVVIGAGEAGNKILALMWKDGELQVSPVEYSTQKYGRTGGVVLKVDKKLLNCGFTEPAFPTFKCGSDEEQLPGDPYCCRKINDHSVIICA